MKVFYGTAMNDAEGERKRNSLIEEHKCDEDFYAVYVDVCQENHEGFSRRKSYRSLMRAISKKKVTHLVVSDFRELNMSEMQALQFVLKMKNRGVIFEIVNSFQSNMSEENIIDYMFDLYFKRLDERYFVPVIVDEIVYVDHLNWKEPSVYFKGNEKEEKSYVEMHFIELLKKFKDGFFIYIQEQESWDYINSTGVRFLRDGAEFYYRAMLEYVVSESDVK